MRSPGLKTVPGSGAGDMGRVRPRVVGGRVFKAKSASRAASWGRGKGLSGVVGGETRGPLSTTAASNIPGFSRKSTA